MQFAIGFTSAALLVINDVLIIVSILAVLIVCRASWSDHERVLVFGSSSLILFKISKSRAALWGETRQEKERLRIKSAQQGFGGVKDIKLYGRENIFEDWYAKETHSSLEAGRKQTILQNIPRIFLEFIAVCSLCASRLICYFSADTANMVAIIGLFAAAAFKLLPTVPD